MTQKTGNPTTAVTAAGLYDKRQSIVTQNTTDFPSIPVPRHIYDKLIKIAAYWGIPAYLLGLGEIMKFVSSHWNYEEARPRTRGEEKAMKRKRLWRRYNKPI